MILVEAEEDRNSRAARVLKLRAHELPHQVLVGVAGPNSLLVAVVAKLLLSNPGFEHVRTRHNFRLVGDDERVAIRGDGCLRCVRCQCSSSLLHAKGHHLPTESKGHSTWLLVPAWAVLGARILLLLHRVEADGTAEGGRGEDGGLVRCPFDLEVPLLRRHLAEGLHLTLVVAPAYQAIVLAAGQDEVGVLHIPGNAQDSFGVASGLLEGICAIPEVPHLNCRLYVVIVRDEQLRGDLRVPLNT
mmetsp:Transcript_105168/g.327888  ORF Transcript_105168/g.327888 Transcript_105168/m.327888 type:complete len:244 (+) Transcript_105168:1515-2246(+)